MNAFLSARTPRERVLIVVLALISAAVLGHLILWQPMAQHRLALQQDIARQARSFAALTALPPDTGLPPLARSDLPLPGIITETVAAYQLSIRRLQPADTSADISIEDAPFDAVLLWVDTLERDHGLRIISLSLTRRPEPGIVAATLIVGR
jgi:general secretion pathway protein M